MLEIKTGSINVEEEAFQWLVLFEAILELLLFGCFLLLLFGS